MHTSFRRIAWPVADTILCGTLTATKLLPEGSPMKSVFLALVVCCLSFQVFARETKEAAMSRASRETIARLSDQIRSLKNSSLAKPADSNFAGVLRCNPNEPEPTTCVPHCTVRYSDGSCGSYGQDICGPNMNCVPHCTVRYSNGSCGSYGADNCGEFASCTTNCTVRYSDGSCGSYGADICN